MSATLTPSPTTAATPPDAACLGAYHDDQGRRRTLVARQSVGGGVLVIDQDADTLADRRLVAHLAADEASVNARIVGELYLADPVGRFARPLEDRDWGTLADGREPPDEPDPPATGELRDRRGRRYRLAAVDEHRYGRQTRWLRRGKRGRSEPVTLRARRERARGLRAGARPDPRRCGAATPWSQHGGARARAADARAQPPGPQPRAA
jgi:hypothetical protein